MSSKDDRHWQRLREVAAKCNNVSASVVNDVLYGASVPVGTDIEGISRELVNAGLRLEIYAND